MSISTPTINWEIILESYLEGTGSWDAVDRMKRRLDLPVDARREIEATLWLVDGLVAAGKALPVPSGAEDRLTSALRSAPAPDVMPAWTWNGTTFESSQPTASATHEDLLNRVIEGTAAAAELQAIEDRGELSEEMVQDFEAFKATAGMLEAGKRNVAMPEGAADRLRGKLRTFAGSEAGQLEPRMAEKLRSKITGEPLPMQLRPPVARIKAANKDEEGEETK